jgi:trk system potassium uptake protein TrkA
MTFTNKNKQKSYLIIGLGRFGTSLAKELCSQGCEVLGVDNREINVENTSDFITHALIGDVTDEKFLESIGPANYDAAIVAIASDVQSSILVTLKLKELDVPYIIARARDELHARLLNKVGADKVIQVEQDMGKKLAKRLASQNFVDGIPLSPDHSIIETMPLNGWIGKNISHIKKLTKNSISILAIKHDEHIHPTPQDDYVVGREDILVLLGENTVLDKIC